VAEGGQAHVSVARALWAVRSCWRFSPRDTQSWIGATSLLEHVKAVARHGERELAGTVLCRMYTMYGYTLCRMYTM
jgi:hypothetical protein